MKTEKHSKGCYTVYCLGVKFDIMKQYISNTWTYEQIDTLKQFPDTCIEGTEKKMKDCKTAIENAMYDLFIVKY